MRIAVTGISVNAETGYGRMNREIAYRLIKAGHEVWNVGHESDQQTWGGTKPFHYQDGTQIQILMISNPLQNAEMAAAMVDSYASRYGFDLIIALWDAWALEFLGTSSARIPWVAYWPIDAPLTKAWADYTRAARVQVAMSKFGYNEMLKFYRPSQVTYIPHGVDSKVFTPLGKDKNDLREQFNIASIRPIPKDAFVLTIVGANFGDRKNLPLLLDTFKTFKRDHEDAFLYLHTNSASSNNGYNLPEMIAERGLTDSVSHPRRNTMIHPATNEELNMLYNASDVLVSNSDGEGFGLPILEAQSAGIPVIAADNSSQSELVRDHGWLFGCIPLEQYGYYPSYLRTQQKWPVPDQQYLLSAMVSAYTNRERVLEYGRKSRAFAEGYDFDNIMPRWERLIRHLQDSFTVEREIISTIDRINSSVE